MTDSPRTPTGRQLVEDEPRLVTGEHDMLTRVLAIEREAAGTEALRAALKRLVDFCDIEVPYWGDMPRQERRWEEYTALLRAARAALASTPPTPDTGLTAERLAEGLREHFEATLATECPDADFDYDECASRILARLTEADQ
jgi:hypothetical protein